MPLARRVLMFPTTRGARVLSMTPYVLTVALHVLAAAVWVGSLVFFALAVAPVVRRVEPDERRAAMLTALGQRVRIVGWACLALLAVTGVASLQFHGIDSAHLLDAGFWAAGFGRTLAHKLELVLALLGTTAAHDVLAPSRHGPLVSWLGRASLLLSIAVLVIAVALVRGAEW